MYKKRRKVKFSFTNWEEKEKSLHVKKKKRGKVHFSLQIEKKNSLCM